MYPSQHDLRYTNIFMPLHLSNFNASLSFLLLFQTRFETHMFFPRCCFVRGSPLLHPWAQQHKGSKFKKISPEQQKGDEVIIVIIDVATLPSRTQWFSIGIIFLIFLQRKSSLSLLYLPNSFWGTPIFTNVVAPLEFSRLIISVLCEI